MGTIAGFNIEAKKGVEAASNYCKQWKKEIDTEGLAIARDYDAGKIGKMLYNLKREALNASTRELNRCIAMVNKHVKK